MTLEIVTFTPAADVSVVSVEEFKAAAKELESCKAATSSYLGFTSDMMKDKKVLVLLNLYNPDYEFKPNPSQYDTLVTSSSVHVKGVKTDTPVGDALLPQLEAPATEIAFMTVRSSPKSIAENILAVGHILSSKLVEHIGAEKASGGAHGSTWGKIVDGTGWIGILGWDTVDDHWKAVAEGTKSYEAITEIREFADISLYHITPLNKL